jgi:peptidoglycan hydrolase CwlO-like protein
LEDIQKQIKKTSGEIKKMSTSILEAERKCLEKEQQIAAIHPDLQDPVKYVVILFC